ncbi:hypothetical protein BDD12DRAFT_840530 [Trichophaea hybrida]|nr:hypothetical protein BDD12DRAFT_840530 [Trichophaea hybrida]
MSSIPSADGGTKRSDAGRDLIHSASTLLFSFTMGRQGWGCRTRISSRQKHGAALSLHKVFVLVTGASYEQRQLHNHQRILRMSRALYGHTMLHSNTLLHARNIFGLMTIMDYSKTQWATGRSSYVPRFLPPIVAKMTISWMMMMISLVGRYLAWITTSYYEKK